MGLFIVLLQHHVGLGNSSRAAVWMYPFECPAPKRFRISQKKWIGWERLAPASFGKARALNREPSYPRFGRQQSITTDGAWKSFHSGGHTLTPSTPLPTTPKPSPP